jgi:RHS repeat-associated protein
VRKDGETPLFDGLGSERTVTNTGGAVQGTLTMTAFGQAVASTGSSTDPYEFAATSGYRNDGDAGLSLVGARYYDAQAGVFISRDTYLDQLPYGYCNGDPVNAIDPDGHSVWKILGYAFIGATLAFWVVEGVAAVYDIHQGYQKRDHLNKIIATPNTMDNGLGRIKPTYPDWSNDPYGDK